MTITVNEQRQRIVAQYRQAGRDWPATARERAAWAIATERWKPQQAALIGQCADEISRAMREEYHTDKQGRRVRTKHAARVLRQGEHQQMMLWADIRSADRDHMEAAFKLRRKQIVGDCRQLSADTDSYNENNNAGAPIQISFDFTLDLIELGLADRPLITVPSLAGSAATAPVRPPGRSPAAAPR